jgi:hypothetical protein
MTLFPKVSKLWYLNLYPDVKEVNVDSIGHYNNYGFGEGRYPNIFQFLNQRKPGSYFKLNHIFIYILFNLINKFIDKKIKLYFMGLILNIQTRELNRYSFNSLILTSWLKDGVEEATKLYIKLQSKKSSIALLKGIKDAANTPSSPMILEIWEQNNLIFTMGILYPVETFNNYIKKHDSDLNLHVHHMYNIESNVLQFLEIASGKKYLYLHDYYIFTTNWHIFLEKSKSKRDLIYFNKLFPNEIVDLRYLVKTVDLFICPSENVYLNCRVLIPDSKLLWIYPPEKTNLELTRVKNVNPKNTYNVLIIGNLGVYKGRALTNAVIDYCDKKALPFNFIHFGREALKLPYLNYTNYEGFDRQNMLKFCSSLDLDFAFLPFQAEETYSFTLSDIMLLGLPLVTTKVGAITERCNARKNTFLIPHNSKIPEVINKFNLVTKPISRPKSKGIKHVHSQRFSREKRLYFFL